MLKSYLMEAMFGLTLDKKKINHLKKISEINLHKQRRDKRNVETRGR